MDIKREDIAVRIENLKNQQEQLFAQLNVCTGALKALEALLIEPKEVEETEKAS